MIPVDGNEGPADVCVIELGGRIGTHTTTILIHVTWYKIVSNYVQSYFFACREHWIHAFDWGVSPALIPCR